MQHRNPSQITDSPNSRQAYGKFIIFTDTDLAKMRNWSVGAISEVLSEGKYNTISLNFNKGIPFRAYKNLAEAINNCPFIMGLEIFPKSNIFHEDFISHSFHLNHQLSARQEEECLKFLKLIKNNNYLTSLIILSEDAYTDESKNIIGEFLNHNKALSLFADLPTLTYFKEELKDNRESFLKEFESYFTINDLGQLSINRNLTQEQGLLLLRQIEYRLQEWNLSYESSLLMRMWSKRPILEVENNTLFCSAFYFLNHFNQEYISKLKYYRLFPIKCRFDILELLLLNGREVRHIDEYGEVVDLRLPPEVWQRICNFALSDLLHTTYKILENTKPIAIIKKPVVPIHLLVNLGASVIGAISVFILGTTYLSASYPIWSLFYANIMFHYISNIDYKDLTLFNKFSLPLNKATLTGQVLYNILATINLYHFLQKTDFLFSKDPYFILPMLSICAMVISSIYTHFVNLKEEDYLHKAFNNIEDYILNLEGHNFILLTFTLSVALTALLYSQMLILLPPVAPVLDLCNLLSSSCCLLLFTSLPFYFWEKERYTFEEVKATFNYCIDSFTEKVSSCFRSSVKGSRDLSAERVNPGISAV